MLGLQCSGNECPKIGMLGLQCSRNECHKNDLPGLQCSALKQNIGGELLCNLSEECSNIAKR